MKYSQAVIQIIVTFVFSYLFGDNHFSIQCKYCIYRASSYIVTIKLHKIIVTAATFWTFVFFTPQTIFPLSSAYAVKPLVTMITLYLRDSMRCIIEIAIHLADTYPMSIRSMLSSALPHDKAYTDLTYPLQKIII